MSARYACRRCVVYDGVAIMRTLDALIRHLESTHQVCVKRRGETDQTAEARFIAEREVTYAGQTKS
jgi:hypothetical protein